MTALCQLFYRASKGSVVVLLVLFGATESFAQTGLFQQAESPTRAGSILVVPTGGGPAVSFMTIQDAVDAASPGDTVLLSRGIFRGPGNRDVTVSGKDIRIEHRGDPQVCVVDAEGAGIGFFFDGTAVSRETLLRGVSIVDGLGLRGGGIRCDNGATPSIETCIVRNCSAGLGGGIYYFVSAALTTNSGAIEDCTIQSNFSTSGSGGLHIANVDVDSCMIVDNRSDFIGAGVGAVGLSGSIRNSVIARNEWTGMSSGTGGGIMVQAFNFRIESCTIAFNKGSIGGGAAFFNGDPSATVANTIVWGNEALFGAPQVWHMSAFGLSVATFRHCDVEGGEAGIVVSGPPPIVSSIFNIDPLFVDGSAGDFQLSSASPLVDMGDPILPTRLNEADSQHEPRRLGAIDLGADEVHPLPALSLPNPGRSGETNTWQVRGAGGGTLILLLGGSSPGSWGPFGRCPSLVLGIADPCAVALRLASAVGPTALHAFVPPSLGGEVLIFQAATLEPSFGPCKATGVVTFSFP